MRISVRSGVAAVFNALVLVTFFYLLINPKLVSVPVTESIYLCVKAIVPSLFIYMVFARMIIAMPFTAFLGLKLGRYGIETEVFVLGNLCGFPIGAKSAVYLYENGTVSKKRAEYLCAFTNNASLSFLLGYIGAILFSDIKIGFRLAIFQAVSSLLTAVILRLVFMKKEDFLPISSHISVVKNRLGLTEAVTDSAFTMLSVCAFIIMFSVLGELAVSIFHPEGIAGILLKSFFEFSSGCALAAGLEPQTAFFAISFAVGFSGLCVIMQVISVMRGKLSPRMYFSGRFVNTVIFVLFSILFGIS